MLTQFQLRFMSHNKLTHWGRVTHICDGKSTIIVSDYGLSPGRRQAIIWTNAGILLIGPLGTNFSEILSGIHTFSFKKMHSKIASVKWRPFCLSLNELTIEMPLPSIYTCIYHTYRTCILSGLILGLHPANERLHYFATSSLIGWVQV